MRLNAIFCVLAVLWLGLLAVATCDTLRMAQWYMIAVAAGLVWTFVFVRALYRRNWGVAVLWVLALEMAVLPFFAVTNSRPPAYMGCRMRMCGQAEHLRAYDEVMKSQAADADFWRFAEAGLCPQAGGMIDPGGESVYHVCVELPREDFRAACAVVAHARLENRRESFSLVLPYERWKQVADSSPWRTPLGLPLFSRRERSVYVQWPGSAPSRGDAVLSAAGLVKCVENAADVADFARRLEDAGKDESQRHDVYALQVLAVHVISLSLAFGLFARLVWRWLKRRREISTITHEP